jgi:cardiolipin synthase
MRLLTTYRFLVRQRRRIDVRSTIVLIPCRNNSSSNRETNNVYANTNFKTQVTSPPNLLTLTRVASTPLLSYLIVTNQYNAALAGCCLAAFSDWMDGYLAKHYNMSTVLGSYLDPLADKILINVLSVSLWHTAVLPTPLVVVWLGRDVALCIGTTYLYLNSSDKEKAPQVHPTTISKINTTLQFVTLFYGIVTPLYPAHETLNALCWITGATTCASMASYVTDLRIK